MKSRSEKLSLLGDTFDVLVIGGGATGLGIALDAATRGYRTVLVEAGDFAQATSSRSTKLVHGGVRYLASGQISLVYEALRERRIMLRNAPHLVQAQPFVTPAYTWFDLVWYGLGLKLYDLLSGRASLGRTRILSRSKTLARLPNIASSKLKGSIVYFDGQFDDARFALALARTAEDHGALVLNYVRCTSLVQQGGRLQGATVRDSETGQNFTVHAAAVINATGIFVDTLRQQDLPGRDRLLSLSRGSHIVVDRSFLGREAESAPNSPDHAIMVPKTPDGRVIFAIPWLGKAVIGTTDLPVPSAAVEPGHSEDEITFLLETINPYLSRPVARADVLAVFSGLRPLINAHQANTAKLSREHHIDLSSTGLVTVAGGKWTTYRRMAEGTLDFAIRHGLLPARRCRTQAVALRGAQAPTEFSQFAPPLARYGTDALAVRHIMSEDPALSEPLDMALPHTAAEVVYAIRAEMARTVEDVLSRRIRALFLDALAAECAAPFVARLMAAELGRDQAWVDAQVADFCHLAQSFYELPGLRRNGRATLPQAARDISDNPMAHDASA